MAAISWTDVVAFASGLSSVATLAQETIIAYVNDELDVDNFGGEEAPKLKLARIYLAAHFGTMTLRGSGAAGPMISSSAGGLSRTYAQIVAGGGSYGATGFGALYKQLLNTTMARVGFAT